MHPRNGLRIAASLYANFPIPVPTEYLLCGEFLYRLDRLVEENGGDNVTEFVKRNMKFLFTHELARQFSLSDKETSSRLSRWSSSM